LVAREAELERITAALDTVRGGQGQLVLLTGEAGVGKTRLEQEVMLAARQHGFQVLVGRCYEEHASVPLFPFVEVVTAGLAVASPAVWQGVARRFPELGVLVPDLLPAPPSAGADGRLGVLRGISGFLQVLSSQGPVAVLLDDLHWADSASVELLGYLARQLRSDAVLLVATYRDIDVDRHHPLRWLVPSLSRERLVIRLNLQSLPLVGTAAQTRSRFAGEMVPDALVQLVHARSEGNPFFTEELMTVLVEQGTSSRAGVDWARTAAAEVAVPPSVQAVVAQRVERLDEAVQEVLRVASVLGQEFELAVLVAATGQKEDHVLDHLDAALAARLLEERRTGRQERYAFAHVLIRTGHL
jgi:predicted ATPase